MSDPLRVQIVCRDCCGSTGLSCVLCGGHGFLFAQLVPGSITALKMAVAEASMAEVAAGVICRRMEKAGQTSDPNNSDFIAEPYLAAVTERDRLMAATRNAVAALRTAQERNLPPADHPDPDPRP